MLVPNMYSLHKNQAHSRLNEMSQLVVLGCQPSIVATVQSISKLTVEPLNSVTTKVHV